MRVMGLVQRFETQMDKGASRRMAGEVSVRRQGPQAHVLACCAQGAMPPLSISLVLRGGTAYGLNRVRDCLWAGQYVLIYILRMILAK